LFACYLILGHLSLLLGAGCGQREAAIESESFDLTGVPISPDLRPQVVAARATLTQPMLENAFTQELAAYLDLEERINRSATRDSAGHDLFRLWRAAPTRFLMIELGAVYGYRTLGRKADRDSMFALPVLADTTTAVGAFLQGRRFYGFTDRGEHWERAALQRAELDSLEQIWLSLRLIQIGKGLRSPEEAVASLVDLIPVARRTGGCRLELYVWVNLARTLRKLDRLDDALHAAVLAADLAQRSGCTMRLMSADLAVASVLYERQEPQPSLDLLETVVAVTDSLGLSYLYSVAQGNIGSRLLALGRHQDRIRLVKQHLDRCLVDDVINAPRLMVNIADSYRALGQVDSSATYLKRARRLVDASSYQPNKVRLPKYEAEHYLHVGNYAKVDSLLAEAVRLGADFTTIHAKASMYLALITGGLEQGQPDRAYASILQLEELRDSLYDLRPSENLRADLDLATARFLTAQGEFILAAEALDRAEHELADGRTEHKRWDLYRGRGHLALMRNDLVGAREAFAKCLALAESDAVVDKVATSRGDLGHVLLLEENYDDAIALFQDLRDQTLSSGRFRSRLSSVILLGIAHARADDHDRALEVFAEAEALALDRSPDDLLARLNIEMGRALAARGDFEEAEQRQLAALARLRLRGNQSRVDELRAFNADSYRDATEALLSLYYRQPDLAPPEGPAITGLQLAESCRWGLSTNSTDETEPVARMIEQRFARGPVLVFFVGERQSFQWVIAKGEVELHPLPGRAELLRRIGPVLKDLGRPNRSIDTEALRALSTLLLGPVTADWPAEATLTIVPDGPFYAVPWGALEVNRPSGPVPVVEYASFIEAPSLSIALAAPSVPNRRPEALDLLAVGVNSGSSEGSGGPDLPELRKAEEEARRVASMWDPDRSQLKVGEAAQWGRLQSAGLTEFGVIHIASHAVVHQGLPSRSTLRLAGNSSQLPVTIPAIGALNVQAELVYLSCCEAARPLSGSGGGVADFAKAFLKAGAGAVIASTLRVDDEAAQRLSILFYEHWLNGLDKASALRQAQLDLAAQDPRWSHPYYWAFFRVIGRG